MSFFAPAVLILIGSVLVAIGGLWASSKQNRFEDALAVKNEEIIQLNQQIAILSHHTMNMVTGGDSYGHISFGQDEKGVYSVFFTHEGRYLLYDLKIHIYDVDAQKYISNISAGNMGNIQHIKFWPLNQQINLDLAGKTSKRFNIFFFARNGTWFQQLIYEKLQTDWSIASRVVRTNATGGDDVLFKSISSDFPTSEQDITWQ